jgi:hypothetical protein
MSNALMEVSLDTVKELVIEGNIAKLNDNQKVEYMVGLCRSLGLNPATKPFQVIKFQGKEILYATKDATEQLRAVHGVSVTALNKQTINDVYVVEAIVQDGKGRTDASTGAVNIKGLSGDNLANAIMKAETKAKRRATLSICGLGFLDESEIETMKGAEKVNVEPAKVTHREPVEDSPAEKIASAFDGDIEPPKPEDFPEDVKQFFGIQQMTWGQIVEFCGPHNWNWDKIRSKIAQIEKGE